jgi:hypothetical protein
MGISHGIVQFTVHFNTDFFSAVATFTLNGECYFVCSELPLHEGRRNRVDPSGSVDLLAGTECDALRRFVCRHRVCPGHGALFVAKEESQILFQLVQDG